VKCRDICDHAQDYADGKHSFWMRMRIRAHLAMCRNCTNFVDQTRRTKRLISQCLARDTEAKISPQLIAAFQRKMKPDASDNSNVSRRSRKETEK